MDQPIYQLTFRARPGTVPAILRLRRLLKGALRELDFVCVKVVEVPKSGEKPQDSPPSRLATFVPAR